MIRCLYIERECSLRVQIEKVRVRYLEKLVKILEREREIEIEMEIERIMVRGLNRERENGG